MTTVAAAPREDGGKLLVVDDSAHIRLLLQHRLAAEGYQVQVAEDGAQGYDTARAFQPDVIVSDLVMPGEDGRALCSRVRQDDDLRACYIIMLTGRDSPEARLGSLAAGADDFLVKPWDERELFARIRSGLRIRRLQHALQLNDQRALGAKRAVRAAEEIANPLSGLLFELQLLKHDQSLSQRGAETVSRALEHANAIAQAVRRVQGREIVPTPSHPRGAVAFDPQTSEAEERG